MYFGQYERKDELTPIRIIKTKKNENEKLFVQEYSASVFQMLFLCLKDPQSLMLFDRNVANK